MIVSINQPAYLPWLGYYHRIALSDVHIVLDHVQFEKNSFINRNKIITEKGPTWLTVPVKTKGKFGNLCIHDLEINNTKRWREKHWKTICHNYGKAPYFREYKAFFETLYQQEWHCLSDICRKINEYILQELGISTRILYSSELGPEGTKDELLLNLCKKINASTYISGVLGKNYLHEEIFVHEGIKVIYQQYNHPSYQQCKGKTFESLMSIIDLLFNCGPKSIGIIMNGNKTKSDISHLDMRLSIK